VLALHQNMNTVCKYTLEWF